MTSAERAAAIAQIERKLRSRKMRPGRRVELGFILLQLRKGDR